MPPAASTVASGLYKVEQEKGRDRTRLGDFSEQPGQKDHRAEF
jgi:hypothetical protein